MELRKRKRTQNPNFSPKSLLFFFSLFFFLFFFFFSHHKTPSFRPSLLFPLLSLPINSISDFDSDFPLEFVVQSRVLFPDHLLLILSANGKLRRGDLGDGIYCVYPKVDSEEFEVRPILSADVYGGFRWVVRCPVAPERCYPAVSLRGRRTHVADSDWVVMGVNQSVTNWDMVVYDATLDGDTVVIFVKGLNLRSDKESDPDQFSCHFELGNSNLKKGNGQNFVLSSKAVSAAQEVIRCELPYSMRVHPGKYEGIQVTVGVRLNVNRRSVSNARDSLHFMPSVAKLYEISTNEERRKKGDQKFELCGCTMVWNQAGFMREWIMYHSWLGIERWFVYDNNSDDGLKEVVEELDSERYNVTRHVWPWIKTQEAGFSHCVLRSREECNWVAFFDVDEFYYFLPPMHPRRRDLNSGFLGTQNSLQTLVANFSSSPTIAEIRTDCHSFGPSGLRKIPVQGVTLGYTCRLQSPERHKSIVRPNAVDHSLMNHVHHFRLKPGFRYLNLAQSIAVVNHYKYQVWDVFKSKFYRRVSAYVADWKENQNEGSRDRAPGLGTEPIEPPKWHLRFCEVWDTGLRDFVLANLADPSTGLVPWERSNLDQV